MRTGGSHDGGADVILRREGEADVYVQCKARAKRGGAAPRGTFVTNQALTSSAATMLKVCGVSWIDVRTHEWLEARAAAHATALRRRAPVQSMLETSVHASPLDPRKYRPW